jgi:hypothetical protein
LAEPGGPWLVRADYSVDEVEGLVEGYGELRLLKHRPFIFPRLVDLEWAYTRLSEPHRQAILVYGLMGHSLDPAASRLGIPRTTLHTRYRQGLEALTRLMNGSIGTAGHGRAKLELPSMFDG